jgi:ribonuclease VapC
MIVDSSAVLAILFDETDAEAYASAIAQADVCRISAANFVEASIVAENYAKDNGARQFDAFVRRAALLIEPVTEEQAHVARQAYAEFGKGGHRAGLNFGDCFAYALAKTTGEKLLFKGDDFRRTDIESAL